VIRALAIVMALAAIARADSPQLDEARRAVAEVRYDDAQRLLVTALEAGGNSPVAVHEIYKLAGQTAVVLGQDEVGERFYRKWLVLDPGATISSDVAPKLRAPFEAARAYLAAHGRFEVVASRLSATEVELELRSDPLALAHGARVVAAAGAAPAAVVPFDRDRRARLATETAAQARAEVLDAYGNTLVELDVAPVDPGAALRPVPPPPVEPSPHPSRAALYGFGIPCVVFLGGGIGFGVAAFYQQDELDKKVADSRHLYLSDVETARKRRDLFSWLGGGGLAIGALLAIPTAIVYFRTAPSERIVLPFVGDDRAGVSVAGRF